MIGNLFSVKYVSVQTEDWSDKKPKLEALLRDHEFERSGLAQFETDRHSNNNRYVDDFCRIFGDELNRFGMEMGLTQLRIGAIWSVRYHKGDYHAVHNHRSAGYSGILYMNYDEDEHTPSVHISPWNDPVSDMTPYAVPPAREGTFVFVPSNVLHFTRPNNSDKLRQIVAFDMEVQ
jgi:hypothetical protein